VRRQGLIALALLGAILVAAAVWTLAGHFNMAGKASTDQLFALKLPDSAGKTLDFAQWRGKPMVVNFWATWCPPCREEMPMLDQAARATPGVQFVGISVDEASHVQAFREQNPTSYPLPVSGMEISPLATALGNKAMVLPFTVFIHADGRIATIKLGALGDAMLQEQLAKLQAER
jgi:thiol-disulfide isomerase/thioredoxin